MERKLVTTIEDCPARLVPTGDKINIPKGNFVTLTQSLGGTYTVIFQGNMARVSGEHGERIGQARHALEFPDKAAVNEVSIANVHYALETVYDPEIPVNIRDLGLVYDILVEGQNISITMTLTSPGCGMGPVLIEEIKDRLSQVPNVNDINVDITFDPPWSRELMTEEAQLELGVY